MKKLEETDPKGEKVGKEFERTASVEERPKTESATGIPSEEEIRENMAIYLRRYMES